MIISNLYQLLPKKCFLFFCLILVGLELKESFCQGKTLKHGAICDPKKEGKGSSLYVGCGALRLLRCSKPKGQTVATCVCQAESLMWDPKAKRVEPEAAVQKTTRMRRILKDDDSKDLGACRLRSEEHCETDLECFTGLKCLERGEEKICTAG